MKPPLIHMHASLGWENPVCLTPSNKTVMGWLSYATQVDLPGSCLVCGKTKDRQMLSLALPTLLVLFPQLPCSTYKRVIKWGVIFLPRGIISYFDPQSTLHYEIACPDSGLGFTAIQVVEFGQIISLLQFP